MGSIVPSVVVVVEVVVLPAIEDLLLLVDDEAAAAAALDGGWTFQILTLQSKELEMAKSPRSIGPRALWKSKPVTGAVWPLYRILPSTPAFAPARS